MAMPILQGRLRGKRWIAGAHTHGCWLGTYESEKQRLFAREVREGNTVYDIGANAGFYTLLASVLVGSSGHVYAFEPLPRNIHFLREHLRLNQITNVDIVEAAVSDKDGEEYFDDSAGAAMGHLAASGNKRVKTVKIDELVINKVLPPPDHLKIDVEGAEFLVLTGAAKVLKEIRPKILLSTHGPAIHLQCCELLKSLGYKLHPWGAKDVANSEDIFAFVW
jgi:FkbM family methyltransferase